LCNPRARYAAAAACRSAAAQGAHCRGNPGLDPKLLKDVLEMLLHCARADGENDGNFGIGLAGRDQRENLTFARGQGQLRELPGAQFPLSREYVTWRMRKPSLFG
jgi:hypothetical protein